MSRTKQPSNTEDREALRPIVFALPDIGQEEINAVVECLKSGWLTSGPRVKEFEADFAGFLGDEIHTVAVNSCTAGLHLVLEALGISPGDEVIVPTFTFTATAEVVRYLGADPVFVDVVPATLNLDPAKVEPAITPQTKAIMPVHFAGLACDMDPILEIARKYKLRVIEDAAHALPASYGGKVIGALHSDATVYSFYVTKTLATGEGGMVVTRDPEIAARCRIMRLHGINRDAFDRYVGKEPAWYYEVVAPGFKYNMTDLAASLGIHQLKKLWKFHRKRAELAHTYQQAFTDLPFILPADAPNEELHAWHLYVMRLHDALSLSRDEFIEEMAKNGIGCSVHFIPLHLHPYWRARYRLAEDAFPNAIRAYRRAVSLPLYTKMTAQDQQRVIDVVRGILA